MCQILSVKCFSPENLTGENLPGCILGFNVSVCSGLPKWSGDDHFKSARQCAVGGPQLGGGGRQVLDFFLLLLYMRCCCFCFFGLPLGVSGIYLFPCFLRCRQESQRLGGAFIATPFNALGEGRSHGVTPTRGSPDISR